MAGLFAASAQDSECSKQLGLAARLFPAHDDVQTSNGSGAHVLPISEVSDSFERCSSAPAEMIGIGTTHPMTGQEDLNITDEVDSVQPNEESTALLKV